VTKRPRRRSTWAEGVRFAGTKPSGSHQPMSTSAQPPANHGLKPLSARRAAAAAVLMDTTRAMNGKDGRPASGLICENSRGWNGVRSITPPSTAPKGSLYPRPTANSMPGLQQGDGAQPRRPRRFRVAPTWQAAQGPCQHRQARHPNQTHAKHAKSERVNPCRLRQGRAAVGVAGQRINGSCRAPGGLAIFIDRKQERGVQTWRVAQQRDDDKRHARDEPQTASLLHVSWQTTVRLTVGVRTGLSEPSCALGSRYGHVPTPRRRARPRPVPCLGRTVCGQIAAGPWRQCAACGSPVGGTTREAGGRPSPK